MARVFWIALLAAQAACSAAGGDNGVHPSDGGAGFGGGPMPLAGTAGAPVAGQAPTAGTGPEAGTSAGGMAEPTAGTGPGGGQPVGGGGSSPGGAPMAGTESGGQPTAGSPAAGSSSGGAGGSASPFPTDECGCYPQGIKDAGGNSCGPNTPGYVDLRRPAADSDDQCIAEWRYCFPYAMHPDYSANPPPDHCFFSQPVRNSCVLEYTAPGVRRTGC